MRHRCKYVTGANFSPEHMRSSSADHGIYRISSAAIALDIHSGFEYSIRRPLLCVKNDFAVLPAGYSKTSNPC